MYNSFNFDEHEYQKYKRPGNKRRLLPYIAIVLVTSLVSSLTVGAVLYGKFSLELEKARISAMDTLAADITGAAAVSDKDLSSGNGAQKLPEGVHQTAEGAGNDLRASTAQVNDNAVNEAGRDIIKGSASGNTGQGEIQNTALPKGSAVTAIAKEAGPAIVGIRMTISGTRYNYFGVRNDQIGEGSGIIINKDGYIMTNYHVVSGADPKKGTSARTILEVFLPDGREAKAVFKGGDEKTDLAVIKIDLENLPTAELGDSSKLEVGELAVAIGNPLGMEFAGSVTVGVISALNRTIEMDDRALNLIQTDAAINEGNSGGALLNSQGQVIGINSVKIAASGVEGLGFAIPINDAWPIVDQLIKYGYVRGRAYIGIAGREISSIYASTYGLAKGIYITDVTQGSGADKAGIRAGDIIVSMAGKAVETVRDLDKIKEAYKPGDRVSVVVDRNGKKISLEMTFGEET